MIIMKRNEISKDIKLPNVTLIKVISKGNSYKYLSVLEAEKLYREEMKEKVTIEYFRRVKNMSINAIK